MLHYVFPHSSASQSNWHRSTSRCLVNKKCGASRLKKLLRRYSASHYYQLILLQILSNYDVTFIQEVRDKSGTAFPHLISELNNCTSGHCKNEKFMFHLSPRYGRTNSKEQYGVIFEYVECNLLVNLHSSTTTCVHLANNLLINDLIHVFN